MLKKLTLFGKYYRKNFINEGEESKLKKKKIVAKTKAKPAKNPNQTNESQ